jgi:DNA-binding NtrC family response regulator
MPKILVVDDEPNITEILEIAFQDDGMDVFKSGSVKDAIRILHKQEIDVVVSDIMMPDLSGVDLLREAKQFVPDTPFIMITAFANLDAAIEALRGDVHDFFPKPVKIKELKASIERAIGEK